MEAANQGTNARNRFHIMNIKSERPVTATLHTESNMENKERARNTQVVL